MQGFYNKIQNWSFIFIFIFKATMFMEWMLTTPIEGEGNMGVKMFVSIVYLILLFHAKLASKLGSKTPY